MPLDGLVDAHIRRLAPQVDPEYLHDIAFWGGEAQDLHVFFHTHATNPDTGQLDDFGTIFRIDGTSGAILDRHDGFIWGMRPAWETSALRQFLIDLHVQLYLPSPWGLIVTGYSG